MFARWLSLDSAAAAGRERCAGFLLIFFTVTSMGLCSGFGLNTVLITEMFLLLLRTACTELRVRAGAALLFFQLKQQCQKRYHCSACLHRETAGGRGNTAWYCGGARTPASTCGAQGPGMMCTRQEVSPLQGPHYCITRCCSAIQALTDQRG